MLETMQWISGESLVRRVVLALVHVSWAGGLAWFLVGTGIRWAGSRCSLTVRYWLWMGVMVFYGTLFGWLLLPGPAEVSVEPGRPGSTAFGNVPHNRVQKPEAETQFLQKPEEELKPSATGNEYEGGAVLQEAAGDLPVAGPVQSVINVYSIVYGVYLLGLATMILRLVHGLVALEKIRLRCRRITHGPLFEQVHDLSKRMGLGWKVAVYVGDCVVEPMVTGIMKPVILLPAVVVTGLTHSQLEAILLHELHHIRRLDPLWNLIQVCVETVLFFHPCVWWTSRELRRLREFECDAGVVDGNMADRLIYARALERLATLLTGPFHPEGEASLAVGATGGHLVDRIRRLLTGRTPESKPVRATSSGMLYLIIVAGVILISTFAIIRSDLGHPLLGDRIGIVKKVNLSGLGGWKNLPFKISPEEEAYIKSAVGISQKSRIQSNSVIEFDRLDVIDELKNLESGFGEHFYVKYLMGTWYWRNGFGEKASEHFEQALNMAPKVLVIKYVDKNRKPLEGLYISHVELECNRVQNRYLDPSLELVYHTLVTDDAGCIYLPVYDTVLRWTSLTHPDGWDVDYYSPGHFKIRGKFGKLPDAICLEKEEGSSGNTFTAPDFGVRAGPGIVLKDGRIGRLQGLYVGYDIGEGAWVGPQGQNITVPAAWDKAVEKIAGLGAVVQLEGFDGHTTVQLECQNDQDEEKFGNMFRGSGITIGTDIGNDMVLFYRGDSDPVTGENREFLKSLHGRVNLIISGGHGTLEDVGEIFPDNTASQGEWSFNLKEFKNVRSKNIYQPNIFGIGIGPGREVPGASLIDLEYNYLPEYEIVVRAVDSKNNYSVLSNRFSSGQEFQGRGRFYGHIQMGKSEIQRLVIQRRPVASMVLEGLKFFPDSLEGDPVSPAKP